MASLKQEYKHKDTFLRRWAAVIILLVFFMASWGGQFVMQLQSEKQLAEQYSKEFQMSEFWPEFWSSTFENWQSEWLQLAFQALLVVGFAEVIFRKGEEEHFKTQIMIEELREELEALHPKPKSAKRARR